MERKIALSELKKAIDEAYAEVSQIKDGDIDPRMAGVDEDKFGIVAVLADGTVIAKGDTDIAAPMGATIKIPISSILLSQNTAQEIVQKSGSCPMKGGCCGKPPVPGAKGIRALSAVEPVGDPDSKWNLLENRMIDLMGSAPILNDKLYEAAKARSEADGEVNTIADAGFYLYDDAAMTIDLYRRAESMTASALQLAMMGATIAADGVNPATKAVVFDGEIAKYIVAMMATQGPHKMTRAWNIMAGLPAKSSFGGTIVGIYPGVMSIAAYSPRLMPNGVTLRGVKAIVSIMQRLDISIFSSACPVFDKER